MKYPILSASCGLLVTLVLHCSPVMANTYVETTSNGIWGETIDNNNSVELASNSSYKSSSYHGATYGFPTHRPAAGIPVFIFNPRIHAWAFYDANGNLLRVGKGSAGSNYCPDLHRRCHTPTGTFHIYAKQGAGCKSKIFPIGHPGAPMPYCSYFHGGFAIHGSYEVRSYNASHGCIRIYPSDAKWLQPKMPIGTIVIVMPY